MSCPTLSYYAIVPQTTSNIFNARYANKKDVEEN
jgi:hypothetical protein